MEQFKSDEGINRINKIIQIKEQIKLLETEKKKLLQVLYFDIKINNNNPSIAIKILEEPFSGMFKVKYSGIYAEILKSQIAALKTKLSFCKSIGSNQWPM